MTGNTAFALCGGGGGNTPTGNAMIFKGYVGTPEQPDLPLPTEDTEGFVYVVNKDGAYSLNAPSYYRPDVTGSLRQDFNINKYSDGNCTDLIETILVEWQGQWSTVQNIDDEFEYRFNNGSYGAIYAINPIGYKMDGDPTWHTVSPGTATQHDISSSMLIKASGQKIAHEGDHYISDGTKWVLLPGGGSYYSSLTERIVGSIQTEDGFIPVKEKSVYRMAVNLNSSQSHLEQAFPNFSSASGRHILAITGSVVSVGYSGMKVPLNCPLVYNGVYKGMYGLYATTEGKINLVGTDKVDGDLVDLYATIRWSEGRY